MSETILADVNKHKHIFLHDPSESEAKIDLVEYWRTLNKYKFAIIAFALAVTLVAGVVAFVMTPVYRATATLLIETNKQKMVTIDDVYGGVGASREYFQTQVEIIKSREVALNAIARLKLYDNPAYDPRAPKKGIAAFLEAIGFSLGDEPPEWTEEALAEAVLPGFSKSLTIEPIRLSQLVTISYDSPSPVLAAQVVNMMSKTYIESDLDARYKMTQNASAWLQDRLTELKSKLEQSEQLLQGYREKQGIVDVKSVAQAGAGEQIGMITGRLIEARTRRAELENAYKLVKGAVAGGDLESAPTVLRSGMVADAKRQEAESERKLAEVSERYGKEHPKFIQATSEYKSAKESTRRQIEVVVAGITQEYEAARGTERMLEGTLAAAKGEVRNLNRKEFELTVNEREVESNRQMYEMFLKRTKETNIAGELQSTVARVVDPAAIPKSPIKPKKTLVIAVALFLGLLMGVMIALMLELLNNTLKTTEDVEAKLKQPLLTVLPMLTKLEMERSVSGRLIMEQPNSLYSEAIRTARTGVLLSAIDLPNRVLLVTSSIPGEGKTTFSINLALAHAHTKKTLLVDADMRRPNVAQGFGLEPSHKGLSELVAGTATMADCMQRVQGTNLVVVSSGAIPPNPLELLLSDKFAHTLEMLATHFDIIVIDSPPVELVSDSLVLAAKATGVIFVVKAESTPYPLARKAIRRLRRAEGEIMGVVLNALDFNKAEKYYGEYSGYGKHGYANYGSTYGATYGVTPKAVAEVTPKAA